MLEYRNREMGCEVVDFPEKVFDAGITEGAYPDYGAIGLGDDKASNAAIVVWRGFGYLTAMVPRF